MFCENCGTKLADSARFCPECGAAQGQAAAQVQVAAQPAARSQSRHRPAQPASSSAENLIGFSPKINDPAFAAYKRKSVTWSFLFASILAVIAIIAFPIYGKQSGELDWPQSLYYGMGIGGMFVVIALLQTIKRGLDHTWDGVVEYKDSYREIDRNDSNHTSTTPVYVIKVRKASGGVKKHKWRGITGPYSYYNVGDQVRHHRGFEYYEKYDKSQDSQILCAACLSMNDIHLQQCKRCKCPLLKG